MKRYIKVAKTLQDYENMGEFSSWQLEQIREGLETGVDVSVYADPKFDALQMRQILKGLEDGVDVSVYADPKFDEGLMQQIRQGLKEGLDVSWYADPKFNGLQMDQIHEGLKEGLDVSWYADPKFTWIQMNQIREGLEEGVDVSQYADPKYTENQMIKIRKSLKEKKPAKGAYAKTIEDYVINGLPDSTGEEFDVVKYVEIVNDNPEYWELSGSDFHDTAFEMFEKDMEQKFPGDEINDDVEAKFYDDISPYGYYDEDYNDEEDW